MKYLFPFFIFLFLFSCKKKIKDDEPLNSTPNSVIFKVNGQLIKMDNLDSFNHDRISFAKQLQNIGLTQTRYVLTGQKSPNTFLNFSVVVDSMLETNYHYDSAIVSNDFNIYTFDLDLNGQSTALYFATDHIDINITSYKNSIISGTFSGRLSMVNGSLNDYSTRGSIYITDGIINSVQVKY